MCNIYVDLRVLIAKLLIAVILTYDFDELSKNLPTLQVTAECVGPELASGLHAFSAVS